MPLPHLHILHPLESRLPGIGQWLAEVAAILREDPSWDRCVIRTATYDAQAGFNVPTQADLIRRSPGAVILIQPVQASLRKKLEVQIARASCVGMGKQNACTGARDSPALGTVK